MVGLPSHYQSLPAVLPSGIRSLEKWKSRGRWKDYSKYPSQSHQSGWIDYPQPNAPDNTSYETSPVNLSLPTLPPTHHPDVTNANPLLPHLGTTTPSLLSTSLQDICSSMSTQVSKTNGYNGSNSASNTKTECQRLQKFHQISSLVPLYRWMSRRSMYQSRHCTTWMDAYHPTSPKKRSTCSSAPTFCRGTS